MIAPSGEPPVLGVHAVRPPHADVACWAFVAAATLNAAIGGFVLVRAIGSPEEARPPGLAVAALVLIAVAYAAALLVLARRFRGGETRARTALFMISLLSLVAANGPGLFVVLILAIANAIAFLRPVTAWLRARDGLRPA